MSKREIIINKDNNIKNKRENENVIVRSLT